MERLVEKEIAMERYGANELGFLVSVKEYKRLFTSKPLLHRLMIGAGTQAFQQWSGINGECKQHAECVSVANQSSAIFYYAPTIFKEIGLTGNTTSLLATGVVGIVNFGLTVPVIIFIDNVSCPGYELALIASQFGRKPLLAIGGFNMAICHAIIAAILAVYGNDLSHHKSAANAAIFMVFWFVANEAYSWGPLAWIVSSEVFPLDMRAKGMSISTAAK